MVAPGEFFVCTADVPSGSDVELKIQMVTLLLGYH